MRGERYIRISLCCKEEILKKALERVIGLMKPSNTLN
jgi:aspartate/methionine/tyrosine aminotransferase